MSDKPKCSKCNQRDATHKGLCSGCYGRQWREQRKIERAAEVAPKQLTSGVTSDELEVIEGQIVHDAARAPETHLVATSPVEMQAAQGDLKMWLEGRLTVLERDIIEANAALSEARKNDWATGALMSARNRAVDDETFYNKILASVEAGYTIIPDFPIQVFAVRRDRPDKEETFTFEHVVSGQATFLNRPVSSDCPPAGAGEYRNPQPLLTDSTRENTRATPENKQPRWYTTVTRYSHPAAPISFPPASARSPVMRATARAMEEKTFDQIGVCLPVRNTTGGRKIQRGARAGDPLIIGQVLRKNEGGKQRCVSFIIAWHLNLNEL